VIRNIIAAIVGGLVTFVTLWVWSVTNFTSDELSAFAIASVLGAIGYLVWPVIAFFWARNRVQNRRDEQIQKEVDKQLAQQGK